MNIGERILWAFSKETAKDEYSPENIEKAITSALYLLENEYADFRGMVSGKLVLDFGCGMGYQSIALVQKYNCTVVGMDLHLWKVEKAMEYAKSHGIPPSKLSFVDKISEGMLNKFDFVISQNSFEHFSDPATILDKMRSLINASGKILISFGPPWLAPYGSHMQYFCKVPWINVIFSEKTVMTVRGRFRNDGATKYEDVTSGLNKMTVAKFESIIKSSHLNIEYKNYKCIKGMNWLAKIPLFREYFINHISVILSKVA